MVNSLWCSGALIEQLSFDFFDVISHVGFGDSFGDFFHGVDRRTMIFAAKGVSNIGIRRAGVISAQIHGNLSGKRYISRAFGGFEFRNSDFKMSGNGANDTIAGQGLALITDNPLEHFFGEADGNRGFT